MNQIIFVGHDEIGEEDTRRQVRVRAAEHSHRIGPRKPKVKRKTSSSGSRNDDPLDPRPILLRRGSSTIAAASHTSGTRTTSEDRDDQLVYSPLASRATSPAIPRLESHRRDPFDAYPVPSQPWYPEVLDYMWQFMLRSWLVLPTTADERAEAILWVKRLTMRDPAYFYMNMLSVVGDLVSRGRQDPRHLVWLTGQVVSTINQALGDRERSLAVGTILAVGRLALREVLVGDLQVGVTFHRPAFARMLSMAGGVEALGLPALVKKHMAWAERLMWMRTGTKISEIEPKLEDEAVFRGAERATKGDMEVLDAYRPYRSKSSNARAETEVAVKSSSAKAHAAPSG